MVKKSLVIVFLMVLILNIVLLVLYLTSNKGKKEEVSQSTYKIFLQAESFDKYPGISWEEITSGKLLSFLQEEDKKGNLLQISSAAIPISQPELSKIDFFEVVGLQFVGVSTKDFLVNKYKNIDIRPFRYVAFFNTKLGNTSYLVLVQKWLNSDGSTAFLPLIIPESLGVKEGIVSTYYERFISDTSGDFLSPIMQIANIDQCKTTLPERESYCDWYFENLQTGKDLLEIMNQWIGSGNISINAGKLPMLGKASRLFKD